MKGILLHGGHGTRLRPLTHTGPKQLLPIANKPMSQYCIESMIDAGITEIMIIVGGVGSNKVIDFYGNGEKFGIKISYIEQDEPRGIAHAVGLCEEFIGNEKFMVFLGDNIIQKNISEIALNFLNSDDDALLLLCEVDNPTRFGIADLKNGKISKIIEKPKNPPTNFAVTGIYFLTPKIFDIIDRLKPSWRNELEITDALQMLLEENLKISYHIITDYWKDTGTPEDIINANKAILEKQKSYFLGYKDDSVLLSDNVLVGKDTKILGTSKIEGPVIIGKNCIINNTRIGPNSSIGDNSQIVQSNIENSIIMSDCTISSPVKIRNSIISSNSKIKSNSKDEKIFLLGEGTQIFL